MTTKMALAISQRTCMGSSGRTQAVRSLQAFPRRRRKPLDLCQKRHTGNRSPLIGNSMKRALRILALAIAMALVAGMPLAFPVAAPPASDLQTQLDAANAAIAGLQLQLALALALALLGILVGAVGLAMGWRMSRGQRKTP